jgi:hypothetical protein
VVRNAVSIAKTAATNFCWIYPRDTIYPGFSQPRSYPHFSAVAFVCDYLTNTINFSKIPKDWFDRRYRHTELGSYVLQYHLLKLGDL